MHIETLPGVGAEITGVDLRKVTDGEFDALRQAYAEHGVIFFRDQDLSEEDHIAFAERWAPINVNRFFAAHPNYPQIAMVGKEPDQKDNIGGGWHTDHSYDEIPAMGQRLKASRACIRRSIFSARAARPITRRAMRAATGLAMRQPLTCWTMWCTLW